MDNLQRLFDSESWNKRWDLHLNSINSLTGRAAISCLAEAEDIVCGNR